MTFSRRVAITAMILSALIAGFIWTTVGEKLPPADSLMHAPLDASSYEGAPQDSGATEPAEKTPDHGIGEFTPFDDNPRSRDSTHLDQSDSDLNRATGAQSENLNVQIIQAFGSPNARFAAMVDDLISDEEVEEPWANDSLAVVRKSVAKHFRVSSDSLNASECLTSVCYVDLDSALSAPEINSQWRAFQDEWSGETLLSRTTVLFRRDFDSYRLYFFSQEFQVARR